MTKLTSWLLGLDQVASLESAAWGFSAPWAQDRAFWLGLGALLLIAAGVYFYRRHQTRGSLRARTLLGVVRGGLLALLVVTLAAPVVRWTWKSVQPPALFVVFDGTDSMAIADPWPTDEEQALRAAVGWNAPTANAAPPSRADYLRAWVGQAEKNVLREIQAATGARLEAFVFDGNSTSQLRRLSHSGSARELPTAGWSQQLTTTGQVTALGSVLSSLREQPGASRLAGVVLFSDFAHNSGMSPVAADERSLIRQLGVPVYTVGLGAIETRDVSVELQTELRLKRAERSSLMVKVRQSGATGETVQVRLLARRLGGPQRGQETAVGSAPLVLKSPLESVEFPYTPEEAGTVEFLAEALPLENEAVRENNTVKRQIQILDDFLRLMYVAHEPDWEWRFVKEVFHRDKLVGIDGFRTYLASSDPRVREANVLFLETLTPPRTEFFRQDVLFLGDLPKDSLTSRFSDMVREFVGNLGGGLVVLAGPRFGPRELVGTPLADLLPVVPDPRGSLRDEQPFRLQRTHEADAYPFMKLGESARENELAWNNLGELPWYQPVLALRDQTVVLAEHPTDKLLDGKTSQPLIAVRPYGRGEVVYLACNELWRLRRKYGDKYYRQFWSQLIYRLGMSHALGASKRFVPRLDRATYRVDDEVTITVEAFNENYEPLTAADLPEGGLRAEVTTRSRGAEATATESLAHALRVPLLRPGVCEARFPVFAEGEYTLRVTDPVTGQIAERRFEVTSASAERRRAVRDVRLQADIAEQSGGQAYDLRTVSQLPRDLAGQLEPFVERHTRSQPLWSTPAWFLVIVLLMIGEWCARKVLWMH